MITESNCSTFMFCIIRKIPNWFHYGCFFKKNFKLSHVSEVSGFDSLRWEDQEKIKGKLSGESSQTGEASQVDGPAPDSSLGVEYAKSSRSSCKSCEDKIQKVRKIQAFSTRCASINHIISGIEVPVHCM